MATNLTKAQVRALGVLAKDGPLAPGVFSGWGPYLVGHGGHRIKISEPTSKCLTRVSLAEVIGGPRQKDKRLTITDAGRLALGQWGQE